MNAQYKCIFSEYIISIFLSVQCGIFDYIRLNLYSPKTDQEYMLCVKRHMHDSKLGKECLSLSKEKPVEPQIKGK